MLALITIGEVLLFAAMALAMIRIASMEKGPVFFKTHGKIWWSLILVLLIVGLAVYAIGTGFAQNLWQTIMARAPQLLLPCLGTIAGFFIIPWVYIWVQKLPRPAGAGLVALLVMIALGLFLPDAFAHYWFQMLMAAVYVIGLVLIWEHRQGQSGLAFFKSSSHADGYSGGYTAELERSRRYALIFVVAYPVLIAVSVFAQSAAWGQGFCFGAYGVGILLTELVMLVQL